MLRSEVGAQPLPQTSRPNPLQMFASHNRGARLGWTAFVDHLPDSLYRLLPQAVRLRGGVSAPQSDHPCLVTKALLCLHCSILNESTLATSLPVLLPLAVALGGSSEPPQSCLSSLCVVQVLSHSACPSLSGPLVCHLLVPARAEWEKCRGLLPVPVTPCWNHWRRQPDDA